MTELKLVPGPSDLALEIDAAAEDAAEHVKHPHAPNTERAYRRQWNAWSAYAHERGIAVLPIDPVELVTYLQLRTKQGQAPNTVRLALAALCALDQSRDDAGPTKLRQLRHHPIVRRWLRGWSRAHPRLPARQAAAITTDQLESLLSRAAERPPGTSRAQHVALYARDRALILLGVTGALRVGELIALDLRDVTITDRGLAVLVRRSKTDQHGQGHLRGLMPQARRLSCPVDAWRCWLAVRGASEGAAFVAFDRAGAPSAERLNERSARRIVERRAQAAGLDLSSHSMRATFATLAHARGKSLAKIADQGNWRKLDVLRPYIRQMELFEDNPSSGLLE